MLVLTRKAGQAILIGPEVAVTVLSVRGDRVKLGIQAPAVLEILRQELAAQVREANLAASSPPEQLSGMLTALKASLAPPAASQPTAGEARKAWRPAPKVSLPSAK